MIFYLSLYFFPLVLSLNHEKISSNLNNILIFLFLLILFYLIGFRFEVGGDWQGYLYISQEYAQYTFLNFNYRENNIGIFLLNKLFVYLKLDHFGLNIFSALIFTLSIYIFLKREKNFWLAICILIPIIIIVLVIGYIKQGIAFSFFLIALDYWKKNKNYKFLLFFLLGMLFHKSLVIFIFLFFIKPKGKIKLNLIHILVIFITFVAVIYLNIFDKFLYYINQSNVYFYSSGAFIRLFINLLPAITFFIFFKFYYKLNEFRLILIFSILTFALLFFVKDYSTIVDRYVMYLSILQLMVFLRISEVTNNIKINTFFYTLIPFLYLSILLIWLLFADNRYSWLPYNIIL